MARIGGRASKVNLPARIALTDPVRAPDPYTVLATLPAGSALIWRAYDTTLTRGMIRALEHAASAGHVTLLIAAKPADARKLGSQNRHLAGHQARTFRKTTYTDKITTCAAHSAKEIIAAARARADAVLISPVFATASHRGAKTLGPLRFATLARLAHAKNLAVYALGGLTDDTKIKRLSGSGHHGVAGIGLYQR